MTHWWAAGGRPNITVYYSAAAPPEAAAAIVTLVKELAYNQTGQALNFDTTEQVLGPDLLVPVPLQTLSDEYRDEPDEPEDSDREPEPEPPSRVRRVLDRLTGQPDRR